MDCVFLDLGGVILEIDWRRTFSRLNYAGDPQAVVGSLTASDVYHRFERGQADADEFFTFVCDLLKVPFEREPVIQAWNALIVGTLPGVEEIFRELSGRVPLCALSNTNPVHVEQQFHLFPVLQAFDRSFLSCEMGHRKPDVEIYREAARAMGVRPERCVFIDDLDTNVEAARRAGFHAYPSVNDPARTLAVLREVLG